MIPDKFKWNENDYEALQMHEGKENNREILREVGVDERIINMFGTWKGTCYLRNGNEFIKEWCGATTEKILEDLLDISDKFFPISRIITSEERFQVLKRQKWRCNICGTPLKFNQNSGWSGQIAHIDHIHPFSKRKTYPNGIRNINELSNLQALCPTCNLMKGKKEIN